MDRSQSEALDLLNRDKHQRKLVMQAKFKQERKQRIMSDQDGLLESKDTNMYRKDTQITWGANSD